MTFNPEVIKFTKNHRNGFSCEEPGLNSYFSTQAGQDIKKKFACVYVLLSSAEDKPNTIGFYSLSAGSIELGTLPDDMRKHLPHYPVPIARIGRLARDISVKGSGIGDHLLSDALLRCKKLSDEIGLFGVVVDAKHEKAKKFYLERGFTELTHEPLTLLKKISDIEKEMENLTN